MEQTFFFIRALPQLSSGPGGNGRRIWFFPPPSSFPFSFEVAPPFPLISVHLVEDTDRGLHRFLVHGNVPFSLFFFLFFFRIFPSLLFSWLEAGKSRLPAAFFFFFLFLFFFPPPFPPFPYKGRHRNGMFATMGRFVPLPFPPLFSFLFSPPFFFFCCFERDEVNEATGVPPPPLPFVFFPPLLSPNARPKAAITGLTSNPPSDI